MMPPLEFRRTGLFCKALSRCISVPVVHALALVPTTKHPHTLPWTTAREALIPPPSVDAVVPVPSPHISGHIYSVEWNLSPACESFRRVGNACRT